MPTYSYACSACGHDFEQYQSFTDDTLTVCPSCGESTLRKLFNNIGVSFNGSGFYRTDSRSESGATSQKSSASPKKSPDAAPSAPAPAAAPSTASTSS